MSQCRIFKKIINFRPFSEPFESVLHLLKQRSLESTIKQAYQKSRPQLLPFIAFFPVQNTSRSYKTLVFTANVCLSHAGGLMRQGLFLEFVRDAIRLLTLVFYERIVNEAQPKGLQSKTYNIVHFENKNQEN